jgi:aspartyl protease family protein
VTLQQLAQFLANQPLFALAAGAILVATLGSMLRRATPRLGAFLRGLGNLGLVAALLITVAQVARLSNNGDFALPGLMPKQVVEGGETRVPMARDGHFWVRATVNGRPLRFMLDTGATLTTVSVETAEMAQLQPNPLGREIMLHTANGNVPGQLATIAELRMGSVVARDLDAVIAPGIGETNVIGMNLLSRLASWRVEGQTLVLVPHHPRGV